jgi:hypothetical protein
MKCCKYCFEDMYLIIKIREYDVLGNCDYCDSEEVYIIDIDDLTEDFERLFKHYESTEPYEHFHPEIHDDPSEFGDRLIDLINEDWNIFSEKIIGTGTDETLLFDILNFNKRCDPEEYIDPYNLYSRITQAFTFVHPLEGWEQIWDNFKDEIKHCNRFFPEAKNDTFNDRIDEILKYRTVYTEKVDLFRARLGVHSIGKMMAPPAELATAGRANPRGISYLYCAIDEPTCIAEIRPWKGATVTVAHIIPKKKLKLVGLFSDPISPFDFESPYEILEIDKILSSFIQELSTPVDPNKSEIEYLPTQYITELIKTKGFDGIFFDSAMGPGNNVVIFDENNVDAKSIQIMKVSNIIYNYD